tara:strand:- start:159 stop:458 length:300 start_codon:yes stop_codon:yes gene_type:complete
MSVNENTPPVENEIEEIPSESSVADEESDMDGMDDMDDMEDMDDMDDMDDGVDLSNFLVTEEGETVADSLSDIGQSLQQLVGQISTTNKILIKMLSKLS